MPGDLNLVMERISGSNLKLWKYYAATQLHYVQESHLPHAIKLSQHNAEKFFYANGNSGDCDEEAPDVQALRKEHEKALKLGKTLRSLEQGSRFFVDALNNDHEKNELWVAYITSGEPQQIPPNIIDYQNPYEKDEKIGPDFAKNIKRFVTVTTSAKALFATHAGVAASIEGVISGARGISVDLHSFAAKVMLMLHPQLLYQINQPVLQMGDILIKAIDEKGKGNVSVGDIGLQEKLQAKAAEKGDSSEEFKEFISDSYLNIERNRKSKIPIEDRLRKLFDDSKENVPLKLMRQYPPLLQVDGKGNYGDAKLNTFTIFARDSRQQVAIRRGDPDYDWVFNGLFSGTGQPFVVIDIRALARVRPILPIE